MLVPGEPVFNATTGMYRLPTLDFYEDVPIRFNQGSGYGFEVRMYLQFMDGNQSSEAMWGPTMVFLENDGCEENTNLGRLCYNIREWSVPIGWLNTVAAAEGPVSLPDTVIAARTKDELSKFTRAEVTSIDSVFSNYLRLNNSFGFGLNLLMDKPEYSNISGDNVGIFGAIHTVTQYFRLGVCARHYLGFVPTAPFFCD